MRKFSRCALILILVMVLGGVGGLVYGLETIQPMYRSVTELYVVPGADSEASLRSYDGGLNDDFMYIIKNGTIMNDARKRAGTSENIASYIEVETPADSNMLVITCINPDSGTAKTYVDAVAASVVNNIKKSVPIESVTIVSTGTVESEPFRPDIEKYIAMIAAVVALICLLAEVIVLLCMSAFRKKEDNSDDELQYEMNYGKYAALNRDDILMLKNMVAEAAATNSYDVKGSVATDEGQDIKRQYTKNKSDDIEDAVETIDGDTGYATKKVNIIGRIRK